MSGPLKLFWFRRDLRLQDNAGLYQALKSAIHVQPIFIFDTEILGHLKNPQDTRVPFLYDQVLRLKAELREQGSDLWIFHGKVDQVFQSLLSDLKIESVYCNHDYEPSAIARDNKIQDMCKSKGAGFETFKDQVIFEKNEILTDARKTYTVYTPYKKKWLAKLNNSHLNAYPSEKHFSALHQNKSAKASPSLEEVGFERTDFKFYPEAKLSKPLLKNYAEVRDFPAIEGTSHLGLHLRFGTVSIRDLAQKSLKLSDVWLSELIWRDFFMQILFHFPHVVKSSFRPEYEKIKWRKSPQDFEKWSLGQTGYPLVDAGMRELNKTGFMHNRVRMVTASFLCKHLLMHWYEGERYFAAKLLDYDLAANNGNWQWAAGSGCDAAPYFRVFNPEAQMERFDAKMEYIKKWVPEVGTAIYPQPMVEHKFARERAIKTYSEALKKKDSK